MLAGRCNDMKKLRYPVLATPKLDGIRCLKISGRCLSRRFKPIANHFIRNWIEQHLTDGVDGELLINDVPFSETAGHVGRHEGEPDFVYHIFDYVRGGAADKPYEKRMQDLRELCWSEDEHRVNKVLPIQINSVAELEKYEEDCLYAGYEGVMVRTPDSPYKFGRSTEKEGWLLKIKRFQDSEAIVLKCVEARTNMNPKKINELGREQRSSHRANLIGKGTLGALAVRDVKTGAEFQVGGFTMALAQSIWENQGAAVGRLITYKHQPSGAKDKPRFPTFVAFREEWDI